MNPIVPDLGPNRLICCKLSWSTCDYGTRDEKMNAIGAELRDGPGYARVRSGLKFRETNWGFAVEEISNSSSRKGLAETALKSVGLVMLIVGTLIVVPGTGFEAVKPILRLGLTAGFVTTGFALFTYASRGFRNELRIDANNRDVTVGTVNSKGMFAARRSVAASDVQSFFLLRAKHRAPARLCARGKNGTSIIKIMDGTEPDLVPVLEKITEAFRPAHLPKGRVRTKATGAFIHATFD